MFNIFGVGCISLELRISDSRDLCWLCWRRAQFVRHTNLSECCVSLDLRSILNVILWVNLVRGCRGVLFLLWNLIGPDGTLGSPFACFERFYESSFMFIVRSSDDGDDRIATINLSESALRIYCKWKSNASIWVYAGAGCAGLNKR